MQGVSGCMQGVELPDPPDKYTPACCECGLPFVDAL